MSGCDNLQLQRLSSGTNDVGECGDASIQGSSRDTHEPPPSYYDAMNQQELAVGYVPSSQGGQLVGPYGLGQPSNSVQPVTSGATYVPMSSDVLRFYQEARYKRLLVVIVCGSFVILLVIIVVAFA